MWLHSQGDIKKVAAAKVKPYKLRERESLDPDKNEESKDDQVMLEDGLKDVGVSSVESNLKDDNDNCTYFSDSRMYCSILI